MKKKLTLIITFVVVLAVIAGVLIFIDGSLGKKDKTNDSGKESTADMASTGENSPGGDSEPSDGSGSGDSEETIPDMETLKPDIEAYFEENSEIISVVSVKESPNTLSEKEAVEELKNRGFTEYPVFTNYNYDGEYNDASSVSETSDDKHPIYQTYFVTSKNELWVITSIDGTVSASPSSYNLAHADQVLVQVAEAEQIASYDCFSNSVYITIPKSTALDVRIVDRIDADTLESLDLEVSGNEAH